MWQKFLEEPSKRGVANPSISPRTAVRVRSEAVGIAGLPTTGRSPPPPGPAASASVEHDAPADLPCRRSEIAAASGGPAINRRVTPNTSRPSAPCRRSPPPPPRRPLPPNISTPALPPPTPSFPHQL